MPTLTFYRQERVDGGIRMGVDGDGDAILQSFEPGQTDADPALLWYVDLRCDGPSLPTERETARRWLSDQAPVVKAAFQLLADKLHVGVDDVIWPYQFPVPGAPVGSSLKITCSGVRGLEVGALGKILRETGEKWDELLERLAPAEAFA